MRILFLPNWNVKYLTVDRNDIQSPDKYVAGAPYWFFRYFPDETIVEVLDIGKESWFLRLEKCLKFYIKQSFVAFNNRNKYDVVVSHGAQSALVFSLLMNFVRCKSIKHVIIDVGGFNGSRINLYETPFIKLALKSCPSIIYHTSKQRVLYEKAYPFLLSKSCFIPFGVDTEYFVPLNATPQKYVLSFGSIKRDYNTLIKSWHNLDANIILKIVGYKKEHEIDGNIEYIPKTNITRLKQYIAESLFVVIPLPVYNYSYGQMSFLQSMSMGKVVLVSSVPSSVDYLEGAPGGFCVEPYSVKDMTDKIKKLLADEDKLISMGMMNRVFIEQNFSEKKMGEEMYRVIFNKD